MCYWFQTNSVWTGLIVLVFIIMGEASLIYYDLGDYLLVIPKYKYNGLQLHLCHAKFFGNVNNHALIFSYLVAY